MFEENFTSAMEQELFHLREQVAALQLENERLKNTLINSSVPTPTPEGDGEGDGVVERKALTEQKAPISSTEYAKPLNTDLLDQAIPQNLQIPEIYQSSSGIVEVEKDQLLNLILQFPALIAVLRAPDHIFSLANHLYLEVVGSDRQIIGQPIRQALPELAGQGIYELLDQVYQSGQPFIGNEIEVYLDPTGEGSPVKFYFNFVYQPLHNEAGQVTGILVHAVNVTQEVHSRHKAEELAAQLEATIESLPDAVYIGNRRGITYGNRRGLGTLGLVNSHSLLIDQMELAKRLNIRLFPTGVQAREEDMSFTQALAGRPFTAEYLIENPLTKADMIVRSAGAPILKGDEIIGALTVNTDITEQKRAEEVLRASEEFKQRILESSHDCIKVLDLDGKLTFFKRSFQRTFRN